MKIIQMQNESCVLKQEKYLIALNMQKKNITLTAMVH